MHTSRGCRHPVVISRAADAPTLSKHAWRRAGYGVALAFVALSCTNERSRQQVATVSVAQPLTLAEAQTLCAAYPGKNLILGSDGADVLDGTNKDDCIVAGSGNDRVHAGNGNDVVFAGDGADEVYGDNGDDILLLGAGNDRAYGGNGNDQIRGDDGDDVVDGQNGDDVVFLGRGNDRAAGGNGNDELHGEDGADVLDGQNGNDTLFGDACHDRIAASAGTDTIVGGTGTDACAGSQCELASGAPVCTVNGNCASGQRCVPASGVCVAANAELCETEVPSQPDAGTCTPVGSNDATCNGVDDDCDGRFDENYTPQDLACGVGACARTQRTSCVNGAVSGMCTAGTPAANDATCDGVDDDCDGRTDEAFVTQASHCGVGACAATGATQCVAGAIDSSCAPGQPGANDATCNRVDDDCNGSVDEDASPQSIVCGVGACTANGTRQCVNGALVDSCTPGTSTSTDNVCNAIDDDCDERSDEDYAALMTSCGVGACASQGQTSCVSGAVTNSCQPGNPALSDAACNGVDDDCDGRMDEDAMPVTVQCGIGACLRTGSVDCMDGAQQNHCAPAEPLADDSSCNGVDDDCDGPIDENYVPQVVSCGSGACAATGTTSCVAGNESVSCTAGTAGSQDSVCNGIDDDCNGEVDEDFSAQSSTCGVGACASSGQQSCIDGAVSDSCQPREPLLDDNTCNGLDDDCDGGVDEDYVVAATSCGRGTCQRTGVMLCSDGATHDSCEPGVASLLDETCNGRDDDCDGRVDENYVPAHVSCGTGACTAVGSTACIDGQITSSCVAGTGTSDVVCNGIDDDCDGDADEDAVAEPTVCGVGACASAGVRTCANGAPSDSCIPGMPAAADSVCNGIDEDCDGRADEDYAPLATYCGVGVCAASGDSACVNAQTVDSCAPHPPAASDANCDERDDDCDGNSDEGYLGIDTGCGIGACRAMGRTICVHGVVADSCSPGLAELDDATCNGVDDDCGGADDEDFEALMTQCGVGACLRSGLVDCVNGQLSNTCQPGIAGATDATCDATDDDCDGIDDEDYQSHATQCGIGACSATGSTLCQAGTEIDTCTNGQSTMLDAVCDGRDEDCDGIVDENYVPQATQCGVGACAVVGQMLCVGGVLSTQCTPGTPVEATDATCDGVDQDCDGQLDEDYVSVLTMCGTGVCAGMGDLRCVNGSVVDSCVTRPSCEANCDDGSDDDQDGFVDCRDSDCAGHCELYCADGMDDDGDGALDCADTDCAGQTGCVPEICGNSLDDDGDGLIDCADLGDCAGAAACPPVPPSASDVAPALDPAATSSLLDRVNFLFSGPDPIQLGVVPGTIIEERTSLITGSVMLKDSQPLPGVVIQILGHPQFGLTHTDEQGQYHIVLNGGGVFTVNYSLPGYMTVQRQVDVRWEDSGMIASVVMLPRSPVASTIDVSGTSTEYQVVAARTEMDADGVRQAVVVFPPGVAAQVFNSSGALVNVPSLNLRLTEITVGSSGRAAMPAELPPSSAYTYAIDITPDESQGIKVNGRDTILSAPVSIYIDNFLSFPIGTPVPTGYYDSTDRAWKAVDNGLVIKLIGETNAVAEIDTDGDDVAEDAAELLALGITEGERRVIATRYNAGVSIWRCSLPHLSTYDMNMGSGPDGPEPPPPPPADDVDTTRGPGNDPNNPKCNTSGSPNSVIDCFSQTLAEEVQVSGTPYTMHYRSDRVPGRLADRAVTIPLRTPQLDQMLLRGPGGSCLQWSGPVDLGPDTPPDSLDDLVLADGTIGAPPPRCLVRSPRRVILEIKPEGQKAIQYRWRTADAPPSQTWTWDGKDDFGRAVTGPKRVSIEISYQYGCNYSAPARFGQYGGAMLVNTGTQTYRPRLDCRVQLVRSSERTVEFTDYRQSGLGGWSLDVNHRAVMTNAIAYGDGTRGTTDRTRATENVYTQAHNHHFVPARFAMGPDGAIYNIGNEGIYRTLWGGTKQLWIPGMATNCAANSPDQNRLCEPSAIAIGPSGEVYVGDFGLGAEVARILRVRPDGSLQRIAGGLFGYSPDGGPALQVRFRKISDIEVGADGTLFVLDGATRTVHRIGTDGMVQRIAGSGGISGGPFVTEADDARTVALDLPELFGSPHSGGGIAIDTAQGGLIIVEQGHRSCSIRHVSTTGKLTTIQRHELCYGLAAPTLRFQDAVVDPLGQLILTAEGWVGVWRMDRSQATPRIERLAGLEDTDIGAPCVATGAYPTRQTLGETFSVALGPDGLIYFNQACSNAGGQHRITRLRTDRAAGQLLRAVSTDAREVFEFDKAGRHRRTLSQLTGQELRRFDYDPAGNLTAIIEADGNETNIEYGSDGLADAIVAPFGQRTVLQHDANGFLSRIQAEPDNPPHQFTYNPGGLMLTQIDPRGSLHSYDYDALGRIARDEDPAGGSFMFNVTNAPRALTVTKTSALGQVTTYDWRPSADGSARYTITLPTGHANTRQIAVDESSLTTMVDGTTSLVVTKGDPVFSTFAPLSTETITTPNGLVRTLASNRTTVLAPDGSASMNETLSDNGRISSRSFVPATRTWTGTSPEGRTSRIVLDSLARVVASDTTGTLPTTLRYDTRGRVARVAQGSDRFADFVFDPSSGYLLATTDALSQTTGYARDSLGRITSMTAADAGETAFTYDGESHLTSVTPPGQPAHQLGYSPVDLLQDYVAPPVGMTSTQSHIVYDVDRRPTSITQPDGLQRTFTYHPTNGQLTSMSIPGAGTTTFGYDVRDRLTSSTRSGSGTVTFAYSGQLLTLQTVAGPHSVSDGATTIWSGSLPGAVLLGYNSAFNVNSVSVLGAGGAPNGFAAQYTRDRDDLITTVAPLGGGSSVPTLTMNRSPLDGHVTSISFGAVTTTVETNTNTTTPGHGDLKSLGAKVNGADVLAMQYQRDLLGRIQRIDEVVQGVATAKRYEYDAVGRLARVRDGSGALLSEYAYDVNGARTSVHTATVQIDLGTNLGCGPTMTTAVDAQDRLCRYGDYDYAYNANGQLATRTRVATGEVTRYTYDGGSRLKSVVTSQHRVDYVHDALGRRIGKIKDGTLSKGWLYQNELRPVAQLSSTGQIEATFVYATKVNVPEFLVMRATGQVYRLITDHLGSVRLVISVADGSTAQRLNYDEFGVVTADTNPGFQPFGFAGGIYDADTGLVRFGARDYAAVTGRWTAKDPSLFKGGLNLYGYANNDPINFIDVTGRSPQRDWELWARMKDFFSREGVPFDMPGGPSRRDHANRNQNNRCPSGPPTMCGGGTEDDFTFDNTPFVGGKYRGAGGSECAYDSNGNLMPDPNQTFNFHPDPWTPGHVWDDVGGHYWYGGADGYNGQQTTPY